MVASTLKELNENGMTIDYNVLLHEVSYKALLTISLLPIQNSHFINTANWIHKNQAKETYQTMLKSMYDELLSCQENSSIHILFTFPFSHDMLMFVTPSNFHS